MNEIAVKVMNLKKTFGQGDTKVEALRGVSLEIEQGELLMLMGPSGSGKTTLISILAGILTPDEGECVLLGRQLSKLGDDEKTDFRRDNIGFVFQTFNLIPMLSVTENVMIPLILKGEKESEAFLKAKAILEEVGLGDKIKAEPLNLSVGQQQRVAIARALVHKPKIIVCDEPTSYLDVDTGARVMQLLRELVSRHESTLIVVTHDSRIMEYADTIEHLEDGRIVQRDHNHHAGLS